MAKKPTYEELQKRVKQLGQEAVERKRAEEALQGSEERFRQFFENQPEYCYMISPEGVILDVNNAALKTLGDILRLRGFQVTQLTDPHRAVEGIGADVDVVLLDMKLNEITGLDLLKEIRARYPPMPVILVTGYREEMAQAIEVALKIKAYTCLYKPFQIEGLIEVLREVHHQALGRVLGQPVRKGR